MKKLFVFIVMALSLSASAQKNEVVTSHKTFDNWYFGINVGAATSMQQWGNAGFMKGVAPSVGLRLVWPSMPMPMSWPTISHS